MIHFRHRRMLLALGLCCLSLQTAAQDHGSHARASEPVAPSPLSIPLDAETRASLPRIAVSTNAHGRTASCEGVGLSDLLRQAGGLPAELHGPALASYVLVTSRDGYRVVYSLAELDPSLSNYRVVLAEQCDGQPLSEEKGPLWLIAAGESQSVRWVRQVKSITVVAAP